MKQLVRRNAMTDEGLAHFQEPYRDYRLRKEDVFYYIYGILHSPEYREKYGNNLMKQLPRIPRVRHLDDFLAFRDSGIALAKLHLFYEGLPLYQGVELVCDEPLQITPDAVVGGRDDWFYVHGMKFGASREKKRAKDKTVVIYNEKITIKNIPLAAYDYVVTGKSPPEWAMDRQRVRVDKASQIKNDANDWAVETMGNPRYPLELFLRLITLSLRTQAIVADLPSLSDFSNGTEQ